MSKTVFPPSKEFTSKTLINKAMYEKMYEKSVSNPDRFWGEVGNSLNWIKIDHKNRLIPFDCFLYLLMSLNYYIYNL